MFSELIARPPTRQIETWMTNVFELQFWNQFEIRNWLFSSQQDPKSNRKFNGISRIGNETYFTVYKLKAFSWKL